MALILRKNTGNDPLTYDQLDGNFEYFTGSHAITGSLVVSGGITGTLLGTASTASFVTLAQTASYVTTAQTASFVTLAQTASYVENAQTASYINPTFISASAAASGFSNTIDLGSLATTGSNVFVGNQTISGSINFGSGSTIEGIGTTLELTPDASLGTDQYIVLDPTAPTHIHVRAGGAIDESNADLYLGGEKANVLVTDSDHQVQINSTATDSSSFSWTFDNEGNTLFPTLTTPRGDANSGDLITNTLKLGDGTNQAVISTPDGTAGYSNSQRLVINPGQGSGSYEGGDIYLWAGRGGVDGGSGGDIKVRGGYGPESGSGGYIRIEGGNTNHGPAGYVQIKGGNSITEQGGDVHIYGGIGNGYAQNGDVTITTYDNLSNAKNWNFDVNGTLTAPGNITADSFTGSLEGTASYAVTASYVLPTSPVSLLLHVDSVGSGYFSGSGFIVVKEYLIPANTLTTSSILEISSAFTKDTGTGAVNMYMTVSSSLYSNFLAFGSMTTSQPYSAFYRNFAISGSEIVGLTPNSTATTDLIATSLTVASSSFDTTVDNSILFVINPIGSVNSTTRLLHNRIIVHKSI